MKMTELTETRYPDLMPWLRDHVASAPNDSFKPKNGVLYVNNNTETLAIVDDTMTKLPCKIVHDETFRTVFLLRCARLKTLEGLPDVLNGVSRDVALKIESKASSFTFKGLPDIQAGGLQLTGFKSFFDLSEHARTLNFIWLLDTIPVNMLQLARIPTLTHVSVKSPQDPHARDRGIAAVNVVNRHLDKLNRRSAHSEMLALQEDLLEAGLDEYATL